MLPLPKYHFRSTLPSLREMGAHGLSDTAAVIPESILFDRSVMLPSMPFGPRSPLIVSDPDLARTVLLDREAHFGRNPFMHRMMRRSWGKGLAAAEGEDWHKQRRAAAPAFRPQAVSAHCGAFASAAAAIADQWPRGSTVDALEASNRIIARVVFSVLVDGQGHADPDAVARDIPGYVQRITTFGLADMIPMPERWHDRIRGIDSDPKVQRVRALAATLARGWSSSSAASSDLIDRLAPVGPIEDNIRGLFPAAMDTTAKAVSWTLFALAHRPEWQDRLASEARDCAGDYSLDRLPQTKMVVQEVLRLFPPAPMLARTALRDMTLDGLPIRAGQPVAVHIYAMHRHHSHWDDPDAFKPERFSPESGPNPAFLPFGLGPRVCIAAQFALAEIMVIVARLLADLVIHPVGPMPCISLQVTTHAPEALLISAQDRAR